MHARQVRLLNRAECLDLLGRTAFGRVGVSIDALPAILPVHYGMLRDSVVFWTVPGTKLDGAVTGRVVAFQVDHYADEHAPSWSVLLQGIATEVTHPIEIEQTRSLPVARWEGWGTADRPLRIDDYQISGRWFAPGGAAAAIPFTSP